jgi:hypothetical protein
MGSDAQRLVRLARTATAARKEMTQPEARPTSERITFIDRLNAFEAMTALARP